MPTEFPKRLPPKLNRWHVAGIAIGYAAITVVMLWVAVERASVTGPVTTGIAPASQSGKRLPIE
jgi:hypothetical protein